MYQKNFSGLTLHLDDKQKNAYENLGNSYPTNNTRETTFERNLRKNFLAKKTPPPKRKDLLAKN